MQSDKYDRFERDYIDYALHFSLWNINSLKGPTYRKLYNKLRNEWFTELGVNSLPPKDSEVKNEYRQYLHIKRTPYSVHKIFAFVFPAVQKISSVKRNLQENGFKYTMRRIWGKVKIHVLKKR